MKLLIILTPLIFMMSGLHSQDNKDTECGLNDKFKHNTKDGKKWIYEDDESLFFTAPMSVNTDGAPTSYHPDDPWGSDGLAINTICNGANALLPNGKVINYRNCKELVKAYKKSKSAGWDNPNKPRMEFYGIAKQGYVPCTIKTGKYKGYFVSTTSQVNDKSFSICEQERYLNALELPFIIYPGHRKFINRGLGKKDIAIFYNPKKNILEYAIVGDKGPSRGLAEGSVFLGKTLNKRTRNPKNRKDTYKYAVKKVHALLLPNTSVEPPYTLEKIRREGKLAFENWGGRKRFDNCIDKYGNK